MLSWLAFLQWLLMCKYVQPVWITCTTPAKQMGNVSFLNGGVACKFNPGKQSRLTFNNFLWQMSKIIGKSKVIKIQMFFAITDIAISTMLSLKAQKRLLFQFHRQSVSLCYLDNQILTLNLFEQDYSIFHLRFLRQSCGSFN